MAQASFEPESLSAVAPHSLAFMKSYPEGDDLIKLDPMSIHPHFFCLILMIFFMWVEVDE